MLSKLFNKFADSSNPSSLSARLREKRFSKFLTLLEVSKEDNILDVGGTSHVWTGSGFEENVTLLNISTQKKYVDTNGITHIRGDACDMNMLENNSFDVVFSNSVIEHVGSFEKQKAFAEEVKRVGQKYWVQTPNKKFPIEPHFIFPFFQYMPWKLREFVGLNWKYSHVKKWSKNNEQILDAIQRTRLLTEPELRRLFKNSRIYKEKFWGVTKSLVVYNNLEN